MRRLMFLMCLLAPNWGVSQGALDNNGVNVEQLCESDDCIYSALEKPIVYEIENIEHWQLFNTELAIKKNGHYIMTGDLAVSGIELAAVLNFKILFYDKDDNLVWEVESGEFEFYSEPGHAEPFVFNGEVSEGMAEKVMYLYFEIDSSKIVPYYDIASDCYLACKNHKLNEALKTFKKSK